jgi:catechol 2,3-dioxygenase-like lactoylglutathione lyase family enzyme
MGIKLFVVSLRAGDLPAATKFYRDVVGLPLAVARPDRPHFDLGGGAYLVILEGVALQPLEAKVDRFPLIALEVDDFESCLTRLKSSGVELPWGVEQDSQRRWAAFYDPAGNLIEIVARIS